METHCKSLPVTPARFVEDGPARDARAGPSTLAEAVAWLRCSQSSCATTPHVSSCNNGGMEELLSISDQSLVRFLARWYGEPDRPARAVSPGSIDSRAPKHLRDWLSVVAQWSRDVVSLSSPLDILEIDADGENLIFWRAEQGVYEWSFAPGSEDPLVYQRGDDPFWTATGESLSQFLLHVTVLDAGLVGAQYQCYAHSVPLQELADIVSSHAPFPLPALDCLSMSADVYVGSETLLMLFRSMSDLRKPILDRFDVSLAATSPVAIEDAIARYPHIDWKRHSALIPQGFSPDDLPEFLR